MSATRPAVHRNLWLSPWNEDDAHRRERGTLARTMPNGTKIISRTTDTECGASDRGEKKARIMCLFLILSEHIAADTRYGLCTYENQLRISFETEPKKRQLNVC